MKRGINKVIILGTVIGDPLFDTAPNGASVINCVMETTDVWFDQGQERSKTERHNIVVFGKLADACKHLITTGAVLYVEGSLKTTRYRDRAGIDRTSTQVSAEEIRCPEPTH